MPAGPEVMAYCDRCGLWLSNGFCLHGTVDQVRSEEMLGFYRRVVIERIERALGGSR